jgi:hypothetical protein
MSFFSKLLGGGDIVRAVGDTLDNLVTSDEERLEKQLEITKAEREFDYLQSKLVAEQNIAQTITNTAEAKSGNMFVAGWRPAIGWVGALALCYQFVIYPILLWIPDVDAPKPFDSGELYTIITGMLGIAGMRSYDKLKNTDTQDVTVLKGK